MPLLVGAGNGYSNSVIKNVCENSNAISGVTSSPVRVLLSRTPFALSVKLVPGRSNGFAVNTL